MRGKAGRSGIVPDKGGEKFRLPVCAGVRALYFYQLHFLTLNAQYRRLA